MTRITTALSLALLVFSSPAFAQDDPDEMRAAAVSYVESPAQQAVIDRLLSSDGLVRQMRASRPDLSEEVVDEVGQIATEELDKVRDPLQEAMVTAAMETYTLAEIEALDEFYRSELGASILLKTQDFMKVAMQSVGADLQTAQQSIMTRANAAIESAQ